MSQYIICLRCVYLKLADCFLSSPSLNICFFLLLSSVKRRHILYTGEHGKWNIKCIVFYSHECLCEILHLISTVVCQMSTLYCGKRGVQKYFLYAQMTRKQSANFKQTQRKQIIYFHVNRYIIWICQRFVKQNKDLRFPVHMKTSHQSTKKKR
jgi:hypothetical protein